MIYLTTSDRPKILAAVSNDATRPVLTRPWLEKIGSGRKARWYVCATDSYKLIALPVEPEEGETLTEGPLPAEAFKEGFRLRVAPRVDAETASVNGTSWERPNEGTPPKAAQLLLDEESLSSFRLGINAKLLAQAAEAMGEEQVLLEFVAGGGEVEITAEDGTVTPYRLPTNVRAIRVRPVRRGGIVDGPLGLVMPVKVSS